MFTKNNKSLRTVISSGSIVTIPGYKPDPDNDYPFLVTPDNGGKLEVAKIAGYEKYSTRALVAVAEIHSDTDLADMTGGFVIVIDKKIVKMAKNPLTRKTALAAIEYARQSYMDEIDSRVLYQMDPLYVEKVSVTEEISSMLRTGEKCGYMPTKKAIQKQHAMLMKSTRKVIKKLYRINKKNSKAVAAEIVDGEEKNGGVVDKVAEAGEKIRDAVEKKAKRAAKKAAEDQPPIIDAGADPVVG